MQSKTYAVAIRPVPDANNKDCLPAKKIKTSGEIKKEETKPGIESPWVI